jgi:hypothetical protein
MTPIIFELKVSVRITDASFDMTVTGDGGIVSRIELPPRTNSKDDPVRTQEERDAISGAFMGALRATAEKARVQRSKESFE